MRNYHIENHTRGELRKMFDIKSSEFNSSKKQCKKVINGCDFGDEVDSDYSWLLNFLNENIDQTKPPMEEINRDEDEDDNEHEDDDDENEDEDEKYKDPQYCMFLKQLTENGKSYKLKISKDDEAPCFLEYEQPYDPSTDMNITLCSTKDKMEENLQINHRSKRSPTNGKKRKILMKKEVSSKLKTEPQNNLAVDSCYQLFLKGSIPSEYGAFVYQGKRVNYEEKVTNSDSDSDSDMLIWDKVRDLSEANKKQLLPAKKEPSLKEKLMRILRKPYDQKEYEELSEYIEQEKPICRLLPLRDRAISSALDGVTKSMLDAAPASFRRKFKGVKNDGPRALNLLRMFRFWLEHLPNEKMFTPWLLEEFMEVLPSSHKRSHVDK